MTKNIISRASGRRQYAITPEHTYAAQRLVNPLLRPRGTRQRYHFAVLGLGETAFLTADQFTSVESLRGAAVQFVANNPGYEIVVRKTRHPEGAFVTCRAKPGSRWNPQPTPAAQTTPPAPKERRTLTFRGLTRREAMLLLDPAADVSNVSGGNLFTAAEVALLTERLPPV